MSTEEGVPAHYTVEINVHQRNLLKAQMASQILGGNMERTMLDLRSGARERRMDAVINAVAAAEAVLKECGL